jgi:hypothetical protein
MAPWQFYALIVILVGFGIYLVTYVLRKRGVIGKEKLTTAVSRPLAMPGTPEKQLASAKAEIHRLNKEIEKRDVLLGAHAQKDVEEAIAKAAETEIQKVLPEKVILFDPERQLIGRPMYLTGGFPLLDKKQEINRLLDGGCWKMLARLNGDLARRLLDYLYFRGGHTLYFYTAQLLPNGLWALTGTSRPAERKGKFLKLPGHVLTYILTSSEHSGIDGLIINKWEVTKGNAAIHLAATIFGPFPTELYGKIEQTIGWIKPVGEKGERTVPSTVA